MLRERCRQFLLEFEHLVGLFRLIYVGMLLQAGHDAFAQTLERKLGLGDLAQGDNRVLVAVTVDLKRRTGGDIARALGGQHDKVESVRDLHNAVLDGYTGHDASGCYLVGGLPAYRAAMDRRQAIWTPSGCRHHDHPPDNLGLIKLPDQLVNARFADRMAPSRRNIAQRIEDKTSFGTSRMGQDWRTWWPGRLFNAVEIDQVQIHGSGGIGCGSDTPQLAFDAMQARQQHIRSSFPGDFGRRIIVPLLSGDGDG